MRKITVSIVNAEVEAIAEILSQQIGLSPLAECKDEVLRDRYREAACLVIEKINAWEQENNPSDRAQFLEAVRLGIGDSIPKINEAELYKVISQGIENGVKKFLKRG
jgi:hypothetical protein